MTVPSAVTARVAELERERKHLLAVIEILKEVSTSLHFIDILQAIARKLGEAFGLDRCSILLAERGSKSVRLVASYEDPTIRNYPVDLERYPELKRAMQSGETVFIPDAANDPSLKHAKSELISRRVKSITVVPITWRGVAIGAIFLRTFRDGPTFSDQDVRFVQVVASLTAQALRNAHRYERLEQRTQETGETVFIPDATTDPSLKHVKGELLNRRVKSITVVPITWRGVAIGAIFLRTFRDGPTFSDEDVRFVQVVAALTAQALRNAHRYERLAQRQQETGETMRRMELERVALLSFLRRLLGVFGEREGAWAEGLLPRASAEELDRLVGVAMAVIQEEAKGR